MYLEDVDIKGYKGIQLNAEKPLNPDESLSTEKDVTAVTTRSVLRFIANVFPAESVADFRIVVKILDQLDEEEEAKIPYVTLDEDWWKKIKPSFDKTLSATWRIHSPFIIDQLEDLKEAGKPKQKQLKEE